MSYSFTLRFIARPFLAEGEALEYVADLVHQLTDDHERIKRQLESERWYLDNALEQVGVTNLRTAFADTVIRRAVADIFSVRMVYWPEFQLAALLKDTLPDELTSELRDVVFQNGTDQDYDFGEWPDGIPLFARLKAEALEMSAEAIAAASPFAQDGSDDLDIDYVRRSLLYQRIFDVLALNDWLYGRKSECFKRATLSGITHAELALDITTMTKKILAQVP